MGTPENASLRADAARNREKIVAAAREVYREHGLGASMRQIALHAGVGEPTLRRRFPTKEELVAEAFQDKIALYADLAENALDAEDAGTGFREFVSELAGMQLADRGFTDVLTLSFPPTLRAEKYRRRAYAAISALVRRAQDEGGLRTDFTPEDLVLVLMAHAGVVAASGPLASPFSARLLAFLLDAFATTAGAPLPPAPTPADTYAALLRLHPD